MSAQAMSALADQNYIRELLRLPNRRGGDTTETRDDVISVVRTAIEAHPRSQQVEIGPSEIGHPCQRWLAYRLANVPATGNELPPWRQAVGTAVHDAFTLWMVEANEPLEDARWWPDLTVEVGELYPGRVITGHTDLYDRMTATVVDLKVPGPSAMKTYKRGDESPQYRIQTHLYGRGVTRMGLHVDHVATLRLPAAGELHDAIWKCEPYDAQLANDALIRAGAVATLVDQVGPAAATIMPTTDHYCHRCPFFLPGSTDLTRGCPGDAGRVAVTRPDSLQSLIQPEIGVSA